MLGIEPGSSARVSVFKLSSSYFYFSTEKNSGVWSPGPSHFFLSLKDPLERNLGHLVDSRNH